MSSQTARERILARLHRSGTDQTEIPEAAPVPALFLSPDREEKVQRLAELMTAIRTEVHIVEADACLEKLQELAREKRWKRMLYGPKGPIGPEVESAFSPGSEALPELVAYTDPVEGFKKELFASVDAGVTSTVGGVADTGAIVLWPTGDEPRLISLVPPVHVAVLDAEKIHNSLGEMMTAEKWSDQMPTNALLISGPSKTADIEFTLVFGVHGPKELVVIIRK